MKKIIIALCAILALAGSAFAENAAVNEVTVSAAPAAVEAAADEQETPAADEQEAPADETAQEDYSDLIHLVDGKVTLWDSSLVEVDETQADPLPSVKVTLETKAPVMLVDFGVDEATLGYYGMVAREGTAPALISITPAHMGEHYNLNNYTMDMLMDYIHGIVDGNYDENNYTSEVLQSEGGNTYVAITDGTTRSISTIYDDFVMEIYQFNMDEEGNIIPLTDEDKAFALEIFQGIWTE